MATSTVWKPTDRQRKAIEYAMEHSWDYSVKELAAKVGINRRTYYRWFETAAFRKWWQDEWERYFALRMARLWGKIFAAACGEKNNSSATHAKLIIERFDKGAAPGGDGAEGVRKTYINIDIPRVTGKADDKNDQ